MRSLLLLAAAPLVLLTACAGAPSGPQAVGATPPGASSYGMFLAGQAAMNDGKSGEAARYFEQAGARSETDVMVAERAFSAAVLAGDIEKAAQLAPQGPEVSDATKRLAGLVQAVEAIADGKGKQAEALLGGDALGFPHRSAAALLAPWAAAQAGDVEASWIRPNVRGDRVVDHFGLLGQALLFERGKRYDEAETSFKAALANTSAGDMSLLAYGGFLERRGRKADAVSLYDGWLGQDADNLAVRQARARAAAGKSPPAAPTIREGAAQALLAPAAAMANAKQSQLALVYLRLVLRLDPSREIAWTMVGDIMQASGDSDAARQAYSRPKAGSPEYGPAQAKLAWTYQSGGDSETALKLARAAAASGDTQARLTLADLLRANDQPAEAAEILTTLISQDKTPDWRLYYGRATVYEKLGRWPEAEKDLMVALKAQPDDPELLNYLGYSWIDRGERLPEALAMVEKAVAANPRSAAMIDSLGWAHYRMGDYKKAVEFLEKAVEIDAGEPDINDHLGDAYWMAGRKDEALFQWRRVLTLQPDDKLRTAAEGKIAKGGLGVEPKRRIAGS